MQSNVQNCSIHSQVSIEDKSNTDTAIHKKTVRAKHRAKLHGRQACDHTATQRQDLSLAQGLKGKVERGAYHCSSDSNDDDNGNPGRSNHLQLLMLSARQRPAIKIILGDLGAKW